MTDTSSRPLVIAIDGPAASGKGTLARRLADHYGLLHLDTGLTYRAVALALLMEDLSLDDETMAAQVAASIDLSALNRDLLNAYGVGEAASRVAIMPSVRQALVAKQREFAETLPGAVLDGRDIGTVVCPDADVKLYVTASPEARALRRHQEAPEVSYDDVLADIARRDARDMGRTDSPLKPADDAHLLDTTEMDIEAAFQAAKSLIDDRLATRT
ncbi:MAG: (d)CMP kinase [Aliihoeflea sp.]